MAAAGPLFSGSCTSSSGRTQSGGGATRPSSGAGSSQPASGASALPTGLVYDPLYKRHLTGASHPESPDRLEAIMKALSHPQATLPAEGRQASSNPRTASTTSTQPQTSSAWGWNPRFQGKLLLLSPRPATDAEVLACHTAEYFRAARRDVESGAAGLSTGDTEVCRDSFKIALLAAGGVLAAVDAVFESRVKNAFCVVRPPGHHATAGRGMGFCIFNNVAIAARYAQKTHKIDRVLIADWDVHHGNGTQDIFYEDGSVFYFSTHLSPHYPGTGRAEETGRGKGEGTKLNCPLSRGAGRKEILGAFQDKLVPAAERFKPDLVLISAGFDSRAGDRLGGFKLTDEDFADLTALCLDIARRHAGGRSGSAGRCVSVLEGGYDLDGLASAAAAHVEALTKA